jgi:hypothetical protein
MNLGDGGYLVDPESEYGKYLNPDLVPFDKIADRPCLVLLGEPGIGKSRAINDIRRAIDEHIQRGAARSTWFDLSEYGNEDRLIRELFQSSEIVEWISSKYDMHLFLDSLDECRLSIKKTSAILSKELSKLPLDRLRLRIRCRTAEWPRGLQQELIGLWTEAGVSVYELCPLRRADVAETARAEGIDDSKFIAEIANKQGVPLAIKPITLMMLTGIFRNEGKLPGSQADLYERGCLSLCEEQNIRRRDARFVGTFSATQRMACASRLAALMIFGGRPAVWMGTESTRPVGVNLSVAEAAGGAMVVEDDEVLVNEQLVRETLQTGLFSGRGQELLGWAHQTYAEFLAARCLKTQNCSKTQVSTLLFHSDGVERRIVPQLHGTAGWVGVLRPDCLTEMTTLDPEAILCSDGLPDSSHRKYLVAALLEFYDQEKLLDTWHGHFRRYAKLDHPELGQQLLPYICDKAKGFVVRRAAINIAEVCHRHDLQKALLSVALDTSDNLTMRKEATAAIARIGDRASRGELKSLLTDQDDDIKAYALEALWPDDLTPDELFDCLNPAQDPECIGAYSGFIYELTEDLPKTALPAAIRWLDATASTREPHDEFTRLRCAIIRTCWRNIDDKNVLQLWAPVLMRFLSRHNTIVFGKYERFDHEMLSGVDAPQKQKLLVALAPLLTKDETPIHWLAFSGLFATQDVTWLVDLLVCTIDERLQQLLVILTERLYRPYSSAVTDALLVGLAASAELRSRLSVWATPVVLNSPAAEEARQRWHEVHRSFAQPKEDPPLDPPASQRVLILLDAFEAGDIDAWWKLNRELTLAPDSKRYGSDSPSAITELPGWTAADQAVRLRLLHAARTYLERGDPATEHWLGKQTGDRRAHAGYRALRLLLEEDTDSLAELTADIWNKWAAIVVSYPANNETGDLRWIHKELIRLAYHYAPDECLRVLDLETRDQARTQDFVSGLWKFETCWDDGISSVLLSIAKDSDVKPSAVSYLLPELAERNYEVAVQWAMSFITTPTPSDARRRELSSIAAVSLLAASPSVAWNSVWSAIESDPDWGRDTLLKLSGPTDEGKVTLLRFLNESQLGDLFLWLARQFRYADDIRHTGAHFVGPRERGEEFRNAVLHVLKQRGNRAACATLERIAAELPALDWLKWTILDARRLMRSVTWQPPSPRDIVGLTSNPKRRIINGGSQLQDLIIESLERLQVKLQAETPCAQFLWNQGTDRTWRPKDENALSDWIKNHLEDDLGPTKGIIANREVEIRKGAGGASGEGVDLHVDSIGRIGTVEAERITVIVEVKGCWHKELMTAMEDQLVNRYLKDNTCQYGLYVVGCYCCSQWDAKDPRQRASDKHGDEIEKTLCEQATRLSRGSVRVKSLVLNAALR